jgi:hypothetical protein
LKINMTVSFQIVPYILMAAGTLVFLLGLPGFRRQTVGRLQAQNFLPIINLKKKDREILLTAGPDLSLMITGAVIFVLGILTFLT